MKCPHQAYSNKIPEFCVLIYIQDQYTQYPHSRIPHGSKTIIHPCA